MRLDSLRLKNFCQHQELDWAFPDGITAISGPNGSGKSNAIKGAYAALTGDFKRNEGVLSENISKTCSDKDESFVELAFSTAAGKAVIKRYLRPNKRSLIVNSNPPLIGDKEITSTIEGLIGVTSDILSDYIFVDQWQMFGIFTLPKSDRLSALQSLYGLNKAETCYDEINRCSSKILVQAPSETVEDLVAQIREKGLLLNSLRESIAAIPSTDLDDSDIQKSLSLVRRMKLIKKDIKAAEDKLSATNKDLSDLELSRPTVLEDLNKLDLGKDSDMTLAEYKRHKSDWSTIREYDRARSVNESRLASLLAEVGELKASYPIKPRGYIESSGSDFERFSNLSGLIEAKKQNLEQLIANKECPVCGTTGDILADAVSILSKYLVETSPLLDDLKRSYQESREYDKLSSACDIRLSTLSNQVLLVESRLEAARPTAPSVTEEDVDKFIADYNRLKASFTSLSAKLAGIDSAIASSKATIEALTSDIKDKSEQCPDTGIDYDEVEKDLATQVALVASCREKKIRFEEQERALVDSVDYLEGRREKLAGDIEEARLNKLTKDHFDNLKEVMHKSNLPKRLTVNYLKKTVVKMNEYLEDFNAPFRIYSDDELVFWAKFNDGRKLPAARLSGGEKVVLALAFRLAVQFGVAAGVNLLVLDEPTVGLDDDNIECLATAFNRLRAMSKSSGLQVLVVSHEKAMERMCDHTLSLYK